MFLTFLTFLIFFLQRFLYLYYVTHFDFVAIRQQQCKPIQERIIDFFERTRIVGRYLIFCHILRLFALTIQ